MNPLLISEKQICVLRWSESTSVPSHHHDFIEIAFLAQGSCLHAWQGTEVRLVPGDVFVIAPMEEHAYRVERKTVIYNCLFYPASLRDDWCTLQQDQNLQNFLVLEPFYRPETGKQEILHLETIEASRLEGLLQDMIAESKGKTISHELSLKSMLVLLLIRLGRAWGNHFSGMSGLFDARRNLLAETLAHIDQNVAENLAIDALAERCHISEGHFRKLFRKTTGLSPLDYINNLRIAMAQHLLNDESLTISQVGIAVGIANHSYFTRLFKKSVGCSPSEFRSKKYNQ